MSLNLICSILYDCELLPFFLRYYSKKGVSRFIFAVWDVPNCALLEDVKRISAGFNCIFVELPNTTFNGEADAVAHNFIRETYVGDGEWYVICDLDEFHELEHYPTFDEAIAVAEKDGASVISGVLLDRVSFDGNIPPALELGQGLGKQFPMACNIIGAVSQAACSKVVMAKREIIIAPGHHGCDGIYWSNIGWVHHFKWFGRVIDETFRRMLSYERQDLYYKDESRILFDCIKNNGNKLPLNDPALQARIVINDPFSNIIGLDLNI
jgi:hypothetical protein